MDGSERTAQREERRKRARKAGSRHYLNEIILIYKTWRIRNLINRTLPGCRACIHNAGRVKLKAIMHPERAYITVPNVVKINTRDEI